MTRGSRPPYAEAHARARAAFRGLTAEQRLDRMREAGIVGETPHVGDKVQVGGAFGNGRYAIVVGADKVSNRVSVVHNDAAIAAYHPANHMKDEIELCGWFDQLALALRVRPKNGAYERTDYENLLEAARALSTRLLAAETEQERLRRSLG